MYNVYCYSFFNYLNLQHTAVKRRAPKKHKLAEEFPAGEILSDVAKGQWKLGPVVGKGGFGLIYLGGCLCTVL